MKRGIKNLVLSLFVFGMLASAVSAKNYPDVPSDYWAHKQIQALTDEEVLVGYPDGDFKPDESATRAEFVTMVIKALHQDKSPLKQTFEFKDVPYKYWAFNTIQRAINFDLITDTPNNLFRPSDTITKKEAMEIMVSALNVSKLGLKRAQKTIGVYETSDDPITRAEMAFGLYNMQIAARRHPNKKLEEAMKAKRGEGVVIRGVKIDGTVATIPAGKRIPVMLITPLDNKVNKKGEIFITKANRHIVTKHNYILIAKSSEIDGEITSVTLGKLFVRNGKMLLDTKTISTPIEQKASFPGCINTDKQYNWFMRIIRFIFRGGNVNFKSGKIVKVKLKKPLMIDLTSGWIIE